MTLGDVWAVGLMQNETIFRDVIVIAQGELGLEEFLRQVGLNIVHGEAMRLGPWTGRPPYCTWRGSDA